MNMAFATANTQPCILSRFRSTAMAPIYITSRQRREETGGDVAGFFAEPSHGGDRELPAPLEVGTAREDVVVDAGQLVEEGEVDVAPDLGDEQPVTFGRR